MSSPYGEGGSKAQGAGSRERARAVGKLKLGAEAEGENESWRLSGSSCFFVPVGLLNCKHRLFSFPNLLVDCGWSVAYGLRAYVAAVPKPSFGRA